MDHRVAHVELGQVLDQGLDVADLFLLLAPARGGAGGEEFGLGDEVQAVFQPGEAGGQRGGGDADGLCCWSRNSASESKAGGLTPLARRKSSRLSRRPSLSASSSTRCGVLRRWALQPGQRLVGAAHHGEVAEFLEMGVVGHVLHGRPDQRAGRVRWRGL
jgi:hypothetical protein